MLPAPLLGPVSLRGINMERHCLKCADITMHVGDSCLGCLRKLQQADPVNSPTHYNQAGIECIDAIKAALGPEGFRDYMMGNVMKYTWRYKYKNGIEDLKKAQWYLSRTITELENGREES